VKIRLTITAILVCILVCAIVLWSTPRACGLYDASISIHGARVVLAVAVILPPTVGVLALVWWTLGRLGLAAIGVPLFAYLLFFPGDAWRQSFRYLDAILMQWCAAGLSEWIK
jgi:hypothetical protein